MGCGYPVRSRGRVRVQAHGRDWEKLCAAVPGKTRTQVKNYYQNYKGKLGLEGLPRPSPLPPLPQDGVPSPSPPFPHPHPHPHPQHHHPAFEHQHPLEHQQQHMLLQQQMQQQQIPSSLQVGPAEPSRTLCRSPHPDMVS